MDSVFNIAAQVMESLMESAQNAQKEKLHPLKMNAFLAPTSMLTAENARLLILMEFYQRNVSNARTDLLLTLIKFLVLNFHAHLKSLSN